MTMIALFSSLILNRLTTFEVVHVIQQVSENLNITD